MMVLTDDDVLADKCRKLRNLYFDENNRFVHANLGWNYKCQIFKQQLELLN